jgi:hypothetical protein
MNVNPPMSKEVVKQAEKFYDAFLREQMFVKIKPCPAWYDKTHWSGNKFKIQTYVLNCLLLALI